MKILFLNYEYPPIGGGASTATEAILKEWTKTPEIEVHLVTAGVGDTYERIHLGGFVFVHRLPIGKNLEKLHSQSLRDIFLYSVKAIWFLFSFIPAEHKKERFDATLAFFTVPCGYIAYMMKLFFSIPYIVSLRGADVPGFSEKYNTFYLFAKPLVRFLWHRAEAVIPNSVGIRELAQKTDASQIMQIIENGVDTDHFQPFLGEKSVVPIVFISTSRLTPRKGIDKLIEAFAVAVKKSVVPIELRLIGEGEQRGILEARAETLGVKDEVKFLGRVEHDQISAVYQQAHVFVLPSKNEGMSNSTLEALASGLPLIVSGTGGMQELVVEGVNGYFIDPDNTESFAEALLRFADDSSSISSYGAESRSRALARGWGKVADHFKQALEESVEKK